MGWEGDPAYEAFGLECYIGGKLATDDRLFGSLCFCDENPREPFTHNEKAFFDLLRQWFSHMLDRRRRLNQAETVFEHTQDALFLIDVTDEQTFTIRSGNRAYEELTGSTIADLRGQTPRERFSNNQVAEVEARFRECVEKREPIEYDVQLTIEDSVKHLHTRLAPVVEDNRVVELVGAIRDMTEQRERQRRYDAIFNQTYQFTGLLEPDGTLIEANETALEFGGLDRDDVIGKKMWEAYWFQHSEDTSERAQRAVERASDGEFVRQELPVQGADREAIIDFSVRPVTDEQRTVTHLIPEGRDITERKERENRLRALNERTHHLVAADSPEQISEIGVEAASEVLGLDANAIHLYDDERTGLVPVAGTDAIYDLVGDLPVFTEGDSIAWRVYDSGETLSLDDVRDDPDIYNPETSVRSELYLPLGDHGILIAGSETPAAFDQQDIMFAEILADGITAALAQVKRTTQLRDREQELTQQNDRLEEFASIVSHDLRSPLNVAEGRLELAKEECESEHLDAVARAHERMNALVDDLLTLAREGKTVGDFEPIDLARLTENCWQNVATADSTLTSDVEQTIQADQSRLAQLLENLMRNAVEHGGEDVTITIGELDDGFYVEDNGPGIPEDEQDDVFEAGYSTSKEGTGFGLSIVKQVAQAHGWDVRVTDGIEGGARFEITGVEFTVE